MAYQFPPKGGLKFTYKGTTVAVFVVDTGGVGWQVVATRLDPDGYNAVWWSGPKMSNDIASEVNAAGSMANWLKQFIAAINTAFAALFGAVPVAGTSVTVENLNLTLANSFVLTDGPNGPVFALK